MNLYEINKEIEEAINECLDFETGEIVSPEKLEKLQVELNKKREGVALYIKNTLPEIKAIEDEIKKLTARKKVKINFVEWLKKSLVDDMQKHNISKFETSKVYISFRKSEALDITSIAHIPEIYIIRQQPKIDKTGLKKLIKSGEKIEGVEIIEKQNIQIK